MLTLGACVRGTIVILYYRCRKTLEVELRGWGEDIFACEANFMITPTLCQIIPILHDWGCNQVFLDEQQTVKQVELIWQLLSHILLIIRLSKCLDTVESNDYAPPPPPFVHASIGQNRGGGIYAGSLHFHVVTITDHQNAMWAHNVCTFSGFLMVKIQEK